MASRASKTVLAHIRVRLTNLRRAMRRSDLDGFLATDCADVSYLSGFSGEDSYLLITRRGAVLITDSRFTEQAGGECRGIRVLPRQGPITTAVAKQAGRTRLDRIGFEPTAISVAGHKELRRALGAGRLVPCDGLIRQARRCKDKRELSAIVRAIKVAEDSFLVVRQWIKVGMTELEVAGRLELEMKIRGSSEPAFSTIVACGARTSMPHVQPGSGRIKAGKPILFDWGASADGYKSDLTRVLFLDSICQPLSDAYATVRQASQSSLAAIRPGVVAEAVDAAGRDVIREAGYGAYFGHGLGHGIGKEIHEGPVISPRSRDILEEGMVFTVEPGIYLPGLGGIRLENDVVVTNKGCRVLSQLPDDASWAVRQRRAR